jgi:hypothetical protein
MGARFMLLASSFVTVHNGMKYIAYSRARLDAIDALLLRADSNAAIVVGR